MELSRGSERTHPFVYSWPANHISMRFSGNNDEAVDQ